MFSIKNGIIKTPFFEIETRPFYIVQFKDGTWSDWWLHGDPKCGCGEFEDLASDKYTAIKKVPILDRITFYQNWKTHLFLLILGFIVGFLF